jgi:hypothetical protein
MLSYAATKAFCSFGRKARFKTIHLRNEEA